MTDKLVTAVTAAIDRVVIMEGLALTVSVTESKWDVDWEQACPYFTNRLAGLVQSSTNAKHWTLTIEARLVLAHASQLTLPDSPNPQTAVWEYVPTVIRYFYLHRQLDSTGLAEIKHIAPPGLTINCPRGMEIGFIPGQATSSAFVIFVIAIPFQIEID